MSLGILALALAAVLAVLGLVGRLLGRKDAAAAPSRSTVPDDRTDSEGKPIPPGRPDERGFVQVPATETIEDAGLFDADDEVVVEGRDILLPEGVENEDVREVLIVRPTAVEIRNNDDGVDTSEVVDLLRRRPR